MYIQKTGSGAKWEDLVGYSRGVRMGNVIEIAGTTAINEHGIVIGRNDPAEQTRFIIRKAIQAIEKLGGKTEHVIRTRMYVMDISQWEAIGKAHGEFFAKIKPAATMVEVSRLVQDDLLVEIEFSAIVPE